MAKKGQKFKKYTPEQKEELLKRVKDMKTKLQGILKAIEKI